MNLIHFEEADSAERTQIGDALARFARKGNRLETGRTEGKFFLNHADGCDEGNEPIRAGDSFYLDRETGAVLCEEHGRERLEQEG